MKTVDAAQVLASANLLCTQCRVPLPLRAARAGDVPFDWQCTACNAVVTGLLVTQHDDAMKRRVRLSSFRADDGGALKLPTLLRSIPAYSPASATPGCRALKLIVPAIALDEHLQPESPVMVLLTREISTTNISLAHVAPWTSSHVALQLPSHTPAPLQLAARVVGCNPLGEAWQINGRFTRRLGG